MKVWAFTRIGSSAATRHSSMKVALILCPDWDKNYPTFGLASLAGSLGAAGHAATIYDLNMVFALLDHRPGGQSTPKPRVSRQLMLWTNAGFVREQFEQHEKYLESFVDLVLSAGHRIVGFSVYHQNHLMTSALARLFKRKDPGVRIVYGGAECLTFHGAKLLAGEDCVDAVVYGEGEEALRKLVGRFERSGRLEAAPGVFLGSEPSTWKDSQDAPADLDALPFADYGAHAFPNFSSKTISSTRGCIRKCAFCSEWRAMKFRQMSGDRLYREIRHQLRQHPKANTFMLGGSLVNGNMKALEDFCDLAIRDPLPMRWGGQGIIRQEMTSSVLHKMHAAGCQEFFYGIESGSENVRRRMNKMFSTELALTVLGDTAAAGIKTYCSLIVGYPGETEADNDETIAFVRAGACAITRLAINVLIAGELLNREADHDIEPMSNAWYWRSKDGLNTFPVRIERIRRLARVAADCGIDACFLNYPGPLIEQACDESLGLYANWLQRRGAP